MFTCTRLIPCQEGAALTTRYIPDHAKYTKLRSWAFAMCEMLRRWQWNFCESSELYSSSPIPCTLY